MAQNLTKQLHSKDNNNGKEQNDNGGIRTLAVLPISSPQLPETNALTARPRCLQLISSFNLLYIQYLKSCQIRQQSSGEYD